MSPSAARPLPPAAGPSRKRPLDQIDTTSRQISPLPRLRRRSIRNTQRPTAATNEDSDGSTDDTGESSDGDDDEEEADVESESDDDDSSDDEPDLTQAQANNTTGTQTKGKGRSNGPTRPSKKKKPASKRVLATLNQTELAKLTADTAKIDIDNYHLISVKWTDRYIDQLLANRKELVNTRPTSDVLAQAEIHQARYRRTKKLLSLIGHCSPMAIDSAL